MPVATRLILDNSVPAAVPVVRTAYECAITSQWLSQVPGATNALLNADQESMTKIVKDLERSSFGADPAEIRKARASLPVLPTESESTFLARCNDLEGVGVDGYVHYRMMCQYTHPSNLMTEMYVGQKDEATLTISRYPRGPRGYVYAHAAACALLWALQPVDFLDTTNMMRSALRAFASELGTKTFTSITQEAWLREQGLKKRAKRTKGPKRV